MKKYYNRSGNSKLDKQGSKPNKIKGTDENQIKLVRHQSHYIQSIDINLSTVPLIKAT